MKVFIAGATGTLGRPVVRLLASRGHDVVGMTRSSHGARAIGAAGGTGVIADALDFDQFRQAMARARPDQVIHLLTALPRAGALRPRHLHATNALRTTGTANLIRAAADAGARRIVAESFAAVYGIASFATPATEDEPLPPVPTGAFRDGVLAMRSLEDQLKRARDERTIDSTVLRIGYLYGSDVPSTRALIEQAMKRRLFAPRDLPGIGPFVHVDDAAAAIVAAVEATRTSPVYNVADDEPLPLGMFLTMLTRALGAPPPRTIPVWLARLAAPLLIEGGSARLRLSNAKAKRELGWTLQYPTVQQGLEELRQALEQAA